MASGGGVLRAPPPEKWSFYQLLQKVSECLEGEAFTKAKRCCIGELGNELINVITDPWDLLMKLKGHDKITEDNIVLLQKFVYSTPDVALRARTLHSIITYAKDRETFFVVEYPPPAHIDHPLQLMHLHININIPERLKNMDTTRLEMDVARIFGVERSRVGVVGVLHGNSVVVTLKIPRECAEMIPYLVELGIKEYITLDVDKIKLEGQMYDLKEKKRVLENVEEHQEDFLSVYENLEKKQQKIKDLEVRHLKLQKQWEEESRNFAKSEIEKQLHKGDLCHPESCVEEAAKITDQIVKFARETQSASHLEHLLKDQKKWTKGNDIKLLAVIVVEALKAGKTSTAEIEPFLGSILKRNREISTPIENNKQLLLNTTLPDRNFRIVIVSHSEAETENFVERLFDKNCTSRGNRNFRIRIEENGWRTTEEKGEFENVNSEKNEDRHAVFVRGLVENIKLGDDNKISEVHVEHFKDDKITRVLHQILLPKNAIYLLLIDLDHQDVDDVAGFIQRWISNIGCHIFDKTANPVVVVRLSKDQTGSDIAKQSYVKTFFDNVKNKCLGFPILKSTLDTPTIISEAMTDGEMSSIRQRVVEKLTVESQWPERPAKYFLWESKIRELQLRGQHVLTIENLLALGLDDDVIPFENQNELNDFLHQQHCSGNIVSLQSEELKNYVILDPNALIDEYNFIKEKHGPSVPCIEASTPSPTGITGPTPTSETLFREENKSLWRSVLQTLGVLLPVPDPYTVSVGATRDDFLITDTLPVQDPYHIDTPKFGFSFPERFFPLPLFHMFLSSCIKSLNLVPRTLHKYGCEFDMGQWRFAVYFNAKHSVLYTWINAGESQQMTDDKIKEERKKIRLYTEKTLNDISRILRLGANAVYYLKCPWLSVLSDDGLYDPIRGGFLCHFHETPHFVDVQIYEN